MRGPAEEMARASGEEAAASRHRLALEALAEIARGRNSAIPLPAEKSRQIAREVLVVLDVRW